MSKSYLLALMLVPLFVASCGEYVGTYDRDYAEPRKASVIDFREVESHDGLSVIEWSTVIPNNFKMSREFVASVEFYDRKGIIVVEDAVKVIVGPGESKLIKNRIAVPTKDIVRIVAAKMHFEG